MKITQEQREEMLQEIASTIYQEEVQPHEFSTNDLYPLVKMAKNKITYKLSRLVEEGILGIRKAKQNKSACNAYWIIGIEDSDDPVGLFRKLIEDLGKDSI